MPGVTVRTGADNTALEKGLSSAKSMISRFKKDASMSRVFESDNKVKRALTGFTSDLANITTWSGLAQSSVAALGNTFKSSLTTGLILGIGGAVIGLGQEGGAAMKELAAQTRDFSSAIEGAAGMDLSALTSQLEKIRDVRASIVSPGKDYGFGTAMKDMLNDVTTVGRSLFQAHDERRKARHEGLLAELRVQREILDRLRDAADIEEMRASGQSELADDAERELRWKRELLAIEKQLGAAGAVGVELVKRRQDAERSKIRDARAGKQNEERAKQMGEVERRRDKDFADQIDRRTDEILKPYAQRVAEREAEQARARAQRRAIEEEVQKEDTKRRQRGGPEAGMTDEQKEAARRRMRNQIANARMSEGEKAVLRMDKTLTAVGQKLRLL